MNSLMSCAQGISRRWKATQSWSSQDAGILGTSSGSHGSHGVRQRVVSAPHVHLVRRLRVEEQELADERIRSKVVHLRDHRAGEPRVMACRGIVERKCSWHDVAYRRSMRSTAPKNDAALRTSPPRNTTRCLSSSPKGSPAMSCVLQDRNCMPQSSRTGSEAGVIA